MEVTTFPRAQVKREAPWTARWCGILTHTHTYSGRSDHGGTVRPPESYMRLTEWAHRLGIAAIGMGSPYTPKTSDRLGQYDERERDVYYAPGFDHRSVMDLDEVQHMLAEATRYGRGQPIFFLDNETPKGRYGHMWWIGYHPDLPAWHDYDQPFDRWMLSSPDALGHGDEPMAYERRPYLEILGVQRKHGAMGFWAHPTSWWHGDSGQFVTNIATEMPVHAMAHGFLDGLVIMGYHPFRPQYQALWYALLDRGYRIPGVAEMDVGLSDEALWRRDCAMLTYTPRSDEVGDLKAVQQSFRDGNVFVSTGPCIELAVDGEGMGQAVRTGSDCRHTVRITAYPAPGQTSLGRLELIGHGGKVVWSQDDFPGGVVEFTVPGVDRRSYLVARVFGPEATPEQWRKVRQFAITSPVYLHPSGQSFTGPMTTDLRLTIGYDSKFHGGHVRFESFDGELLGIAKAEGTIDETLPASGRITLIAGEKTCTHYLINANRALQDVERYLYRGRFLLDYPLLTPGEVPPPAWRLSDYASAMARLELAY